MNEDHYAVCRYIRHYQTKNGFLPGIGMLGVSKEYVELLARNGVVELIPLYEGGPAVKVGLTDKGRRMADGRR